MEAELHRTGAAASFLCAFAPQEVARSRMSRASFDLCGVYRHQSYSAVGRTSVRNMAYKSEKPVGFSGDDTLAASPFYRSFVILLDHTFLLSPLVGI
jgi:hypothetical protein